MPRNVPHRGLRDDSGRILPEVQSGDTIAVTNRGEVVALLVPPPARPRDTLRVRTARTVGGFSTLPRASRQAPSGEPSPRSSIVSISSSLIALHHEAGILPGHTLRSLGALHLALDETPLVESGMGSTRTPTVL